MSSRFVRAPNTPVLIAAGIVLLLLAAVQARVVATTANTYHLPVGIRAGGVIKFAILGTALLWVALRRSQLAGATAVIAATFLLFGVVFGPVTSLIFGTSIRVNWWTAINLAIAAVILWPSLFPWDRTANRPVFFWMGLIFGALTLLLVAAAALARL